MNGRLFVSRILSAAAILVLAGCRHSAPSCPPPTPGAPSATDKTARRYTYTPRPYPVDERGFSPVDKALSKAFACEEKITPDAEGSLNPFVLKVISAYPLDGSYPYHCGWT